MQANDFEIASGATLELDLGFDGLPILPKHDKPLILDADTIAFAACVMCEYEVEVEEDGELITNWDIDLDEALIHATDKINLILDATGCRKENTQLYFTGGRSSFRYKLLEDAFPDDIEMHYKYKRKKKKTPEGLMETKLNLLKHFAGDIFYDFESDDWVVYLKKKFGDDVVLGAVDKDVIKNVKGRHFNYYERRDLNIAMKWVDIDSDYELYNQYLQVITGDKSDNIPGLPGIGPKKATKFIDPGMTEKELWDGVLTAYIKHCKYGDPEDMAILNMRLVNMHQLNEEGVIEPWNPKK